MKSKYVDKRNRKDMKVLLHYQYQQSNIDILMIGTILTFGSLKLEEGLIRTRIVMNIMFIKNYA